MKKTFLLVFMVFSLYASAQKPSVSLNIYGGYVFDDKVNSYYSQTNFYDGKVMGGLQWGGGLELETSPYTAIEILYTRQDTKAPTNYCNNTIITKYTDFDLNLNYLMLCGIRKVRNPGSPIEGYGGLMAGCFWGDATNPEIGNRNTATKFAWGLKLGCNIWATNKVALKLQGQLLTPVQSMGGGLYFGTGGTGAGVSTYSTMYQFSVGGGLAIKLGK
ncbi:MAG: hypothetical protein WCO63_05795 [Bacteroidota bacterium]